MVKLLQIADVMLVFLIALWILCNKIVNKSAAGMKRVSFARFFIYKFPMFIMERGKYPILMESHPKDGTEG